MNKYSVSLKQGRTDTLTLEADSITDVLTFFNTVSSAVVSSIKKIVFSKEYDINYIASVPVSAPFYDEVLVFAKSENKAKVFKLYFVKKTVTKEDLFNEFKKLNIDNEKIIDIYNIQFIAL